MTENPAQANLVWIQSRDGSPTLWSNELGECFRSLKGAFTESWGVFVEPALKEKSHFNKRSMCIGEFGLGPGTNWLLSEIYAQSLGLELDYFVIEKDPQIFELGLSKWDDVWEQVVGFLGTQNVKTPADLKLADLSKPRIYPSLEAAIQAGERCSLWYHDPFGADVNPEGYWPETLRLCTQLWENPCEGFSYACNRSFQNALIDIGAHPETIKNPDPNYKRQRLRFKFPSP